MGDDIDYPVLSGAESGVEKGSEKGTESQRATHSENSTQQRLLAEIAKLPIALFTDAFQLPPGQLPPNNDIYGGALIDPRKEAALQFNDNNARQWRDKLREDYVKARTAIMNGEQPKFDKPIDRRRLAAYWLGDGDERKCGNQQCADIRRIVGNQLLPLTLKPGATGPLNPNRMEANEAQQWARLASLLVKDDNSLRNAREINRNNPDINFRPPFERELPPDNLAHHLPEKFSTPIFTNADGSIREFNVRELCEKEMAAIFRGDMDTRLNHEEMAVLAFNREVRDGVLPWWLLDPNPNEARGRGIINLRDKILGEYATDFKDFRANLTAVGEPGEAGSRLSREQWLGYLQGAVGNIPSPVQGWDTNNRLDADLIRDTIRLARWRYLSALEAGMKKGLLQAEPQPGLHLPAISTPQGAELPRELYTYLRAVVTPENRNQFSDPSPIFDDARLLAMWQIRQANQQTLPYVSNSGIGAWISRELSRRNVNGQRVFIADDGKYNSAVQKEAMQLYPGNDAKSNERRKTYIDSRQPAKIGSTMTLKEREEALDRKRELMEKAERQRIERINEQRKKAVDEYNKRKAGQ